MSWKYFIRKEFECKCGCGGNLTASDLIDKLDEVRGIIKRPIIINSGYRCVKHNKAVGGKRNSAHRKGLAADIKCPDNHYRFLLVNALLIVGFTRIGIGAGFVHADISPSLPQEQIWPYND